MVWQDSRLKYTWSFFWFNVSKHLKGFSLMISDSNNCWSLRRLKSCFKPICCRKPIDYKRPMFVFPRRNDCYFRLRKVRLNSPWSLIWRNKRSAFDHLSFFSQIFKLELSLQISKLLINDFDKLVLLYLKIHNVSCRFSLERLLLKLSESFLLNDWILYLLLGLRSLKILFWLDTR